MQQNITRRGMVAGAAALAMAGAAGAVASAQADVAEAGWDMEAEIVVIGSGAAGMACALTAMEQGANVLMLEKMGCTGGDTALCGQTALGPWPEEQAKLGIEDSIELYLEDLADSYKWGAFAEKGLEFPAEHPFTVLQTELTPEVFAWTRDVCGIGWAPSGTGEDPISEGVLPQPCWSHRNARSWMAMDPESSVMKGFNQTAAAMGLNIRMRTEADELICDESGRVIGVVAYDENDQRIRVKATKAVVLATGSFCSNRGMMERYLPDTNGIAGGGCFGVTGDGIRMARAIGASVSDMDLGCHWYPYEAGTNSGQFSTTLILFGGEEGKVPIANQPGIVVNYDGERFVSESNGYHLIGRATAQQKCQEAWYIFDAKMADLVLHVIPYENRAIEGETLEDLCRIARLPYETVAAQVDDYNAGLMAGQDRFGKVMEGCAPIDMGPFYALNIRPRPYATYGGLDIDLDCRVLDEAGEVIPGLYAAGIVTGAFASREGYFYNGCLSQALVYGRLCGKKVVEEAAWAEAMPTGMESAEQMYALTGLCTDCHGDGRMPGTPNYHNF